MKHSHKASVAFNAGQQLVAVRFKIEPPAAVHISIRAVQSFDVLQQTKQPMHPWAYYGWLPNPYDRSYTRLRVTGSDEETVFHQPELTAFEFKKTKTN
jgi:hypothetical protein